MPHLLGQVRPLTLTRGTEAWKEGPRSHPCATLLPVLGACKSGLHLLLGSTTQVWPKYRIKIVSANTGPPPDTGRKDRSEKPVSPFVPTLASQRNSRKGPLVRLGAESVISWEGGC